MTCLEIAILICLLYGEIDLLVEIDAAEKKKKTLNTAVVTGKIKLQ